MNKMKKKYRTTRIPWSTRCGNCAGFAEAWVALGWLWRYCSCVVGWVHLMNDQSGMLRVSSCAGCCADPRSKKRLRNESRRILLPKASGHDLLRCVCMPYASVTIRICTGRWGLTGETMLRWQPVHTAIKPVFCYINCGSTGRFYVRWTAVLYWIYIGATPIDGAPKRLH